MFIFLSPLRQDNILERRTLYVSKTTAAHPNAGPAQNKSANLVPARVVPAETHGFFVVADGVNHASKHSFFQNEVSR